MLDIKSIADRADMIVNGYAFERKADGIHVLNLNHPDKALVFNSEDEAIETTMDDIEINKITQFIKANYQDMYITWANHSMNGFYGK